MDALSHLSQDIDHKLDSLIYSLQSQVARCLSSQTAGIGFLLRDRHNSMNYRNYNYRGNREEKHKMTQETGVIIAPSDLL